MLSKELSHNRMYKARIFEMLYREKKEALELYNAINGTNYEDPELLEIVTLDNAVYMSMKNDVSILVDCYLSVYEQQSTYNPNMPLRFLLYVSDLYSVLTKDMNLYSTSLKKIPTPKFLVFYNGEKEQPEIQELKLSDAFFMPEQEPELELKVKVLNINEGQNLEIKEACKSLKDYADYTGRIRKYAKKMPIKEAVEKAIEECMKEGVLAEFLSKNRAEAMKMSIYEYDEEKHMRQEREEWKEIGRKAGEKVGEDKLSKLVKNLLDVGRIEELEQAASDEELRKKLYQEFGI